MTAQHYVMICAGSGITAMFPVFRTMMRDPDDPTTCVVLEGNRREEEILCRAELDDLVRDGGGRGRVVHSLTRPPDGWTGLVGRVGGELVREDYGGREGKTDGRTLVLVCGPRGMGEEVRGVLVGMGWREKWVLVL